MSKKSNNFMNVIFLTIIFYTLYFIIHFMLYEDIVSYWNQKYNLNRDGFCIFKDTFSSSEIYNLTKKCEMADYSETKEYLMTHKNLNNLIHRNTSKDHIFQDYIFIIKKSAIHTCHRDSNGDFFNETQKYPSYTMLIFLEDMEKCLGVIPHSHKDVNSFNINFSDPVSHLVCKKGDIILFNANLIHVGALNSKDDNLRIQMKVTHKDDIEAIPYYNNYNKILNEDNNMPFLIRKAQRKLSCLLPIISNLSQKEIQRTSGGDSAKEKISVFQKIFSSLFYGNSSFYNLPNAF